MVKFTKPQAGYRDNAILYRCNICRHYDRDNLKCELVSEEGSPDPGEIRPNSTCRLYNAIFLRIWLLEKIVGRGPSD